MNRLNTLHALMVELINLSYILLCSPISHSWFRYSFFCPAPLSSGEGLGVRSP